MKINQNQRGFIKYVILIVIGILILSYFGFDIKKTVESEQSQSNLSYVWGLAVYVWDHFLAGPVIWVWSKIIVGFLWNTVLLPMMMKAGIN